MSLALYRKYRPSIFADVIGQEHVTTPLSNALDRNILTWLVLTNSLEKWKNLLKLY